MSNNTKTSQLLGIGIGSGSLEEIINDSIERIERKSPSSTFVCANPHSLVISKHDREFTSALNNSNYSVADGVGVTLISKFIGVDVGPRIAGHDYFEGLLSALNSRGSGRVFFFGSSESVLSFIQDRFAKDYPNLELCGTLSPPFGDWSEDKNEEMIAEINAQKPDVLWVGMTAPKQEKWVEANRGKIQSSIVGSIGAVFDFYAGTYPRAPALATTLGLEWLFRLVKEPKRMWRRNFVSTPLFLFQCFIQHVLLRKHKK